MHKNFIFMKKICAEGMLDDTNGDGIMEWGKRYYFHDHLGSIRAIIDGNGNYLANYEYWPYGEEMTSSTFNEDTYRYTGHERDYDINMDYMRSRHYKYGIARFQTPDEENGKVNNPLSFNLYIYSLDNPLKFYDPFGKAPVLVDVCNITTGKCEFKFMSEEELEESKKQGDNKEEQKEEELSEYEEYGVDPSRPPSSLSAERGKKIIKELNEAGEKSLEWAAKAALFALPIEKFLKIPVGKLIGGDLKRVKGYPSELEHLTYEQVLKLSKEGKGELKKKAQMLKKLVEQGQKRIKEKYSQKPK